MFVHAFDPGATTGFVILKTEPKLELVVARSFTEFGDYYYWSIDLLQRYKPDAIVVEDFHLYPHMARHQIGSSFPSAQYIGIIKYIVHLVNRRLPENNFIVTMQPASCKEPFDKDHWWETVTILPQLSTITSQHIRDAAMHALYYWFNRKVT